MAVRILGKYLGDKKVEMVHEPSGATLITDAPLDNQGQGRNFSPTDLVPAALGACVMTVMGIVAERNNLDLSGLRVEVEKIMADKPRVIAALPVVVHMPKGLGQAEREKLERTALTCPVHASLNPSIKSEIKFVYDV